MGRVDHAQDQSQEGLPRPRMRYCNDIGEVEHLFEIRTESAVDWLCRARNQLMVGLCLEKPRSPESSGASPPLKEARRCQPIQKSAASTHSVAQNWLALQRLPTLEITSMASASSPFCED